ncbi:AcrB/AcrD/AcrF family protein [Endozoicomonas sp. OPT23]|uniref:efflux RND transporter permease subunit n=1 Tax=Endozoicomonas sp. OPT23 TaxID=2072845 RepID=UPI00129A4DFA|nr:efflux RND transporter permease subunit [Endozoicomonas sp. OPT23]MRI33478.1 AcrB/AcrD/AcrF family protein [Endozoicomonas sp. OPT23]
MRLPALAIKNRRFTLIAMLLLILLGLVSLQNMPRSEDPQFEFPATMIQAVYPGTNPMDMEKLIVDPIEEVINELDDIKVLKANIEDGLAVIRVEFLYGSDPQDKYDDVVSSIARIRDQLPNDIAVLNIDRISPVDVNIIQIAIKSEEQGYDVLKPLAEKFEKRLERIPGVKRAETQAFADQQLQIKANLEKMKELGIGLEDLINAIKVSGVNLPGGHVLSGNRRFTVRTSGDFRSLKEIRRTAVLSSPGKVIYVEDIADVGFGDALPSYLARYQGKKSVFVTVVQREGSNIFNVMEQIKSAMAELEEKLPEGVALGVTHDQTESVDDRISQFFDSLVQGLLLVGILTLLFLGFRPAMVIIFAIPLSFFIGIGWLDLAGFGIQQMSIAGLVIALGLLVDNAIVVTENVDRFLRQGYSKEEAAAKGASQVGWAVVSGTFTTILAFVPILMLQTGAGIFLRSMPVTVILTLLASLLIALMLTPLMASMFLQGKKRKTPKLLQALDAFAKRPYRRLLSAALRHPIVILSIAVLTLAGSVMLAGKLGVSMFPKAEKPMFMVNIELPEGSSFDDTTRVAIQTENIVKGHELVRSISTNIGKGNPRIYYNIFPSRQVPNYAQLVVRLHTGKLSEVEPFVEELRTSFAKVTGARITIKELLQGPPYEAPIAIRVVGDDLNQVLKASRDVESFIEQTAGTVNVDNPLDKPKVDLKVSINREKAAMYGVAVNAIDQVIRASLVGVTVSQFRDEVGEDFPIVVSYQGTERPRMEDFDIMMVKSASGKLIPIKQLVSLKIQSALPRFQHHMTERMVRITADIKGSYQAEALTNQIIEKLDQYVWPEGVYYQIGGEQEQRKESFAGMTKVLLIALIGIFAVLVLQFNSFSQPLVIFAAIPFAVTGMILALWLAGFTFSFTAFIGLTSLVGIVVNNSIILVDYANQLRKEGNSITEAIIMSGQTRLLPILLTTMTTIGGLLPLTLSGSSMWAPMGSTIIGGLLVSTLLTLIVVPVLYKLMSKKSI